MSHTRMQVHIGMGLSRNRKMAPTAALPTFYAYIPAPDSCFAITLRFVFESARKTPILFDTASAFIL